MWDKIKQYIIEDWKNLNQLLPNNKEIKQGINNLKNKFVITFKQKLRGITAIILNIIIIYIMLSFLVYEPIFIIFYLIAGVVMFVFLIIGFMRSNVHSFNNKAHFISKLLIFSIPLPLIITPLNKWEYFFHAILEFNNFAELIKQANIIILQPTINLVLYAISKLSYYALNDTPFLLILLVTLILLVIRYINIRDHRLNFNHAKKQILKPNDSDKEQAILLLKKLLSEAPEFKKRILTLLANGIRQNDYWHKKKSLGIKEFNLKSVTFKKADLSYENLEKINLRYAKLQGSNLCYAKLNQCDLYKANLNQADLRKTNLTECNLKKAKLRKTDLRKATLSKANLINATARYAKFNHANLKEARMQKMKLSHTHFNSANISEADLTDANLRNADLSEADLSGAILCNANLRNVDIFNAKLLGANIKNALYNFPYHYFEIMNNIIIKQPPRK